MIVGLGSDLCNIERLAKVLEKHGERFEQRCFTDVERAKAVLALPELVVLRANASQQ